MLTSPAGSTTRSPSSSPARNLDPVVTSESQTDSPDPIHSVPPYRHFRLRSALGRLAEPRPRHGEPARRQQEVQLGDHAHPGT